MKKLFLILLIACAGPVKQLPPAKKCAVIVVFTEDKLPVCSYVILKAIDARGIDSNELYRDIQIKVCDANGQFLLSTKIYDIPGGFEARGFAGRCNVPFLLPSDLRNR